MSGPEWRTRIRWVVVHPHAPLLLAWRRAGALVMPESERAGEVWTADPTELLPMLAELLGAEAVLLGCLEEDEDPSARAWRAVLLAVPRGAPATPAGASWVGHDRPDGAAFADDGQAALAARVLAELEGGREVGVGRPWAARGWFAEAEAWLVATMERLGRPVTGPVRQVRVWELSCILRAPTAAGDVYLKASGAFPLFVNEGVVVRELARLFPGHVPAPLALDAGRGWMVLADFGAEIGWAAPVHVVEQVARTFARIQIEAAPHVDRLLAAGCHDRRLDRLAAEAAAWLPALEPTGRLPGIDAATWLTGDEAAALAAAVPRLQAACAELAGFRVPPSIVHGDLHMGNVADGPAGFQFFDWTDACIAHPFLDLPTIRRGTGFAEVDGSQELRERLREAYLAEWAAFEPPARLRRAWDLSVPLGALHQAISYRSIAAELERPLDLHMAQSTAWWLRMVLAGLAAFPP
jgi:hypothetical protein